MSLTLTNLIQDKPEKENMVTNCIRVIISLLKIYILYGLLFIAND